MLKFKISMLAMLSGNSPVLISVISMMLVIQSMELVVVPHFSEGKYGRL